MLMFQSKHFLHALILPHQPPLPPLNPPPNPFEQCTAWWMVVVTPSYFPPPNVKLDQEASFCGIEGHTVV